jgi:hypothetical protein
VYRAGLLVRPFVCSDRSRAAALFGAPVASFDSRLTALPVEVVGAMMAPENHHRHLT